MARHRVPCSGVSDERCVQNFLAKIGPPDENGCRRWTAHMATDTKGRRRGYFGGGPKYGEGRGRTRRPVYATRFMWTLTHGDIPYGLDVLHTCDNSECCQIEHLYLGTPADNMADMARRFVRENGAEGSGSAKLTRAQAREIFALAHGAPMAARQIAEMYGIHTNTVYEIKAGKTRRAALQELI